MTVAGNALETQRVVAQKSILVMTMFNDSSAGIVFAIKLLSIFGSVLGMYFFVRLVFNEPFVSFMFFLLTFDGIVFYSIRYDRVYVIPAIILDFRQQLAIEATMGRRNSKYFYTLSRSMRLVGVKVGSFRNMERNSTLLFLDFFGNSVASMLLTF